MSDQMLIAVAISVLAFIAMLFIIMRFGGEKAASEHRKKVLSRIYQEQEEYAQQSLGENVSILKAGADPSARFLMSLPVVGENAYQLLLKAGAGKQITGFLIACGALFFILLLLLSPKIGAISGFAIALLATILLPRFYLRRKIAKRNEAFINMFPDAVDMIVRSVKSGHPLNTALKMIAENMDPPVSAEFRQLVEEIAYGRSTTEALLRMAQRVDEPDLQFFVVILSVQQETGGNLAEVLSNLSSIIRKRKQLRLKIKAMTSEGRATAYILGGLPFMVFGALHLTNPDYLVPLWTTTVGMIILSVALGLVALAAFIVYNMLQIDI